MISIVMPSYLGQYRNAAKNRPQKLVRAIKSVINQDYTSWELIIISDGCQQTVDICKKIKDKTGDERIKIHYLSKQPIWSGSVRNHGLGLSSGQYACYLDIDDAFAPSHLEGLAKYLKDKDWYWTDDYVWNGEEFRHRKCNINKPGQCGTSNLIHKPGIAQWNIKDNYAHDWNFIRNLKKASRDYEYIKAGKYLVCHIPGKFDI